MAITANPIPNILYNYSFKANNDGTYEQYLLKYNYSINEQGEVIYDTTVAEIALVNDDGLIFSRTSCVPEFVEVLSGIVCTSYTTCTGNANHGSPTDPQCTCENTPQTCYKAGASVCNLEYSYVYQGCPGGTSDDPGDPTDPGTNTGGGDGSTYPSNNSPDFNIVPVINVQQQIVTILEIPTLGPNAQLDLYYWIMHRNNRIAVAEIYAFLLENGFSNEAIQEAKLTVTTLASEVPWTLTTGNFKNIPSLPFNGIRTIYINGTPLTQYKLVNGDIISEGDYGVWQDTNYKIYYYSQVIKKWFEMPEPTSYSSLNIDFIFDNFWSTVETGTRYFTPIEDAIILIEGKDFDGVEQSMAVAGIFVILDVAGGKVVKIVKKLGTALTAASPVLKIVASNVYKIQKAAVTQYRGLVESVSNLRKGNFGEMATDVDLYEKGYKPLHANQIDNIDSPGHNGIDHVFKNDQNGEYLIIESKYHGTGGLNPANPDTNLPRQMSDIWIQSDNRLLNSLGGNQTLTTQIINTGYTRVLARINPDGSVYYTLINAEGYLILGNAGIFTP